MAITYDYYRIFYYVAQYHSFTQAAEALNNNQPNVTRCMNNLEQELGCKLFVRSHRGVVLTPEGERLYVRVAVAFEQLQLGEEELHRDCGLVSGTLSISASGTALHLALLDKLSAFHTLYPGVRLRIINESTPCAVASLLRSQSNCAVVTSPQRTGAPLHQTELCRFREVLICGRQYMELASKTRRLQDLAPYSFVCRGPDTSTYAHYQRFFVKHDLPFRVDMEAATMGQILPMVQYNLGIGFFPEALAAPAIERGEVFQVRLAEPIPQRTISLIEDPSRPQSLAMKALKRLLCPETPGTPNS